MARRNETEQEDIEIKYIDGASRFIATPERVSIELIKTALPQQIKEKETTKKEVRMATPKKNIGPMLDPKKISPIMASKFIVDIPEIDPHLIKSVSVSSEEVVIQLYDSYEPNTRDQINLLLKRMGKTDRINWFGSKIYTNTNLAIKHVNATGDVLVETICEGLTIPNILLPSYSYSDTDFAVIILHFYCKTMKIG